MKNIFTQYVNHLAVKGYSTNTIEIYTSLFKRYLYHLDKLSIHPEEASQQVIKNYLEHLIFKIRISHSLQNQTINAIKFYYEKILHRPKTTYYLERPLKKIELPKVLSKKEIKLIFHHTINIKHQCILGLGYSAGLRIGEVINLKISDIDSERMMIRIEQGKGRKDRYTILSKSLLEKLRKYYRQYKPEKFLFEGFHHMPYSNSSKDRCKR